MIGALLSGLAARGRLVGCVAAAAVVAALVLGLKHEKAGRATAEAALVQAEARVAAAQAQARLNEAARTAVLKSETRAAAARTQAQEAVDEVLNQPGAQTPAPDAVLAAWRAGLLGLRRAGGGADRAADPADG